MITGLDFVAVPSTDLQRSIDFYTGTLGLRKDAKADFEFWVDSTCFGVWNPADQGLEFKPQNLAHIALHVDDLEATRTDLESKGVEFLGDTFDTGVCYMALFKDPDGNDLMLHHRYA